MKKLHFSLLAILFALFAMVSFTACSSDDEDTPSTEDVQTYIIGMWQPTHVTGYDWDENDKPAKVDKDIDIDIDDAVSFEFEQGGTFNEYYWTGNKWKIDCSGEGYTISGNKLTSGCLPSTASSSPPSRSSTACWRSSTRPLILVWSCRRI